MPAKMFAAFGAAMITAAPFALWAQSRPMSPPPATPDHSAHSDHRPGETMQPGRPGGGMQPDRGGGDRPGGGMPGRPGGDMRPGGPDNGYGNWDNKWGARPSAPPRGWNKKGDWYRHVRACQQRFRSYNPRTDMYSLRRGVNRRCTL